MKTTTHPQLGLLDGWMTGTPANDFLQGLDQALDWKPIEQALQAMYPATTGRPPCPPLALFKMCLLGDLEDVRNLQRAKSAAIRSYEYFKSQMTHPP
jgi:hypothetical protein